MSRADPPEFTAALDALGTAAEARYAAILARLGPVHARGMHDLAVAAVDLAQPGLEADCVTAAMAGRMTLDQARMHVANSIMGIYLATLAELCPWSVQ